MQVVHARNVNHLYPAVVDLLRREGRESRSRAGDVLVLDTPFCAVYDRPQEMVLLDPARGCNPFFHVAEALWMLGARSDAAYLDNYVKDFGSRFANEQGQLDGAYGVRWRSHFPSDGADSAGMTLDQLDDVVGKLKRNPDDRRIVIQMWDPTLDNDPATKDACCNQQIMLRIVRGALDMTVTCRSNDAVWGALGANAVHFPFLQQYLAGRICVPSGKFYQISNNYHVYKDVLAKIGKPRPAVLDPYARGEILAAPIGDDFNVWDEDLKRFLDWHDELWSSGSGRLATVYYRNTWFAETASLMVLAFWRWRKGDAEGARATAARVAAEDWRAGAVLWLDQAAIRAAARAEGKPREDGPSRDVRSA